jgi:hypothetical protein
MIEAGNMARFESLRPSWPEFADRSLLTCLFHVSFEPRGPGQRQTQ